MPARPAATTAHGTPLASPRAIRTVLNETNGIGGEAKSGCPGPLPARNETPITGNKSRPVEISQ
jgi:hypothetical protein